MAYSSIVKPSVYFNTKLYTGNGSTNAQTGVGFQPDFTWLKARSESEYNFLYDAVRGATKGISSDLNAAEATYSDGLTAFASDGFTLGSSNGINRSGTTYASWNWKAGTGQGSSNTDGSTNTTYTSVNTTAGFSISKYTGTGSAATIGHGLGAVPATIIVKNLSSGSRKWAVWHKNLSGNNKYLSLSETNAEYTDTATWNNTAPTSTVFSSAGSGEVNQNGENFIAYCFAEKKGYSKFGSYTGNGNADGTFIYTGFKPAFVILKRTNGGTNDWVLYDTKRCINGVENALEPNTSNSESQVIAKTDYNIDLLSNGFKPRSNSDQLNGNGDTYIYMAFAEEPLVANSGSGVPATAR